MDARSMLSFIVPVYNGERYLSRCVDSILDQTVADYEVILVNDGSTDNTESVCLKYADADGRIKYVSQSNQGVSAARNTGIMHARGQYVCFVDADDWVAPRLAERVMACFSKADIVYFGYEEGFDTTCVLSPGEEDAPFDGPSREDLISRCLCPTSAELQDRSIRAATCWGKVYRRSFITDHRLHFPVGMINCEDAVFNLTVLANYPSYHCLEAKLYYYYIHPSNSGARYIDDLPEAMVTTIGAYRKATDVFQAGPQRYRVKLRLFYFYLKLVQQYYCHPDNPRPRRVRRAGLSAMLREPLFADVVRHIRLGDISWDHRILLCLFRTRSADSIIYYLKAKRWAIRYFRKVKN